MFDTSTLDKAVRERRQRLAAEQGEMLDRVIQARLETFARSAEGVDSMGYLAGFSLGFGPSSRLPLGLRRFEETMHANDAYRDSRSLTNWTRSFLYAGIAVSVVAFGSNAMEYQLLVAMRDGFSPGDAAVNASDARQAWVGLLQAAVYLPTMVLVLMWIYRANYNARGLGACGLRFSPAGSIGWYFVPILTLWRPYQAMKEIWQASLDPQNWLGRPVPWRLPIWWALWLVSMLLAQLELRLWWSLDENSGIEDFIAASIAAQAAAVWEIPLALVLLAIMNSIYRMQVEHRPPLPRPSARTAQTPTRSRNEPRTTGPAPSERGL